VRRLGLYARSPNARNPFGLAQGSLVGTLSFAGEGPERRQADSGW
jgi:hypothetical protein